MTAGVVVLLDQGERVRLAPQLARLVQGDTWSTRWVGLTVVPPAQDDRTR